MQKYNLLIIDDHPLFRKGVISVVSESGIFSEIYEASNIKETFEILEKKQIDLMILDINLPDVDGLTIIKDITFNKRIPILVLTSYSSSMMLKEAQKRGAKGYLSKEDISENLIDAIKIILNGEAYFHQTNALEDKSITNKAQLYFTLTNKEKDIFRMLAEGKTVKEIAYETGKSIKTVENQRLSIYNKLNIKNENELIKIAIYIQIIDI
jgi:DNA-binding NarL/FixJ family response regulator